MSDDDLRAIIADRVLGRFYGKYEGVVEATDDRRELGRIRARVPAVLGPELLTGWALPCAPFGGGAGRGFLALPEPGDTVWIEFAGGDVSRPIWSGAFWGAPESTGGDGDLGTRTGSELPASDGETRGGPGRLVLRTRSGHRLYADDDAGELVLVAGEDGATIRLDAQGVVTIEAGTIKLGAGAGEKLILGDSFMQLFNQHTHPTGVGPSGPPTNPMTSSHLSQVSSTE
ncbi:MAG: hypothetical protein HS111_19945 [Kofleriaceae bacterium]|nr:hypothetical protein [Kofleriaceae bacterium]MCL4225209.1 hypothetical protein [Myxococcales bacterium]